MFALCAYGNAFEAHSRDNAMMALLAWPSSDYAFDFACRIVWRALDHSR